VSTATVCSGPYPSFALQARSNDPNFQYQNQYANQGGSYGYIQGFTSSFSSTNKFHIDTANDNELISPANDNGEIAFVGAGDATIYIQTYYGASGDEYALSCSITSPGAGLLTCSATYNNVDYTVFQFCNGGNPLDTPTGVSIDTQVASGCQGPITCTAIPVCTVAST